MLSQEKDYLTYSLESKITEVVLNYLNKQPDIAAHKISDRFKKGISDILCCVQGTFVAIELKAKDGTASPHQKAFIKGIVDAGGLGGVCFTLGEVKNLVQQARERHGSSR